MTKRIRNQRWWATPAVAAALAALTVTATAAAAPVVIDRAVARFTASETGGLTTPRFVYERELSFEARLHALQDLDFTPTPELPFRHSHVQDALEHHIAETLLESLSIDPEPTAAEMSQRTSEVKLALLQRVGGVNALQQARNAEGIADNELISILRRRARASLYLDRMVAPMLAPSVAELQSVHRSGRTPYSSRPFSEVQAHLERWYVSEALKDALLAFYEDARGRVGLQILTGNQ